MFRMEGLYHKFELIKTTNFEYFYITSFLWLFCCSSFFQLCGDLSKLFIG